MPAGAWGAARACTGAAGCALEAAEPGAPVAGSGGGAFAGSTGAVLCAAGAGDAAGLVNTGRGAAAGSGVGGGASLGCGGCAGAVVAAAKGASVAVRTESDFAGGAGGGVQDMPSSTNACSAIDASTHQSRTRSPANVCMRPAATADKDMSQE